MNQKHSLLKPLLILVSLPLLVVATKTVVDWRKSAAIIPANIAIDAINSHSTINPFLWQNFAQGGEEASDMIGPVATQVRSLQPKLIRIDHLFDNYQMYQSPGNYNFTQLDKAIDSILATGAKPMLSLSYTPASMSSTGQVAGPPTDWNQWRDLVKATAFRYSVEKQIDGIYYEVWNEPDLFGGWHYSKNPSYIDLYLHTSQAVAQGASGSKYKIGGPATTSFYPNWFRSLFMAVNQNRLRLDFISWHRYTKNMADLEDDIDKFNTLLRDFPYYYGLERLITEIGPNSEPDPWYDNSLSGIHLLATVNQLAGKVHRLFSFELVDGPPNTRNGSTGWGMITHPLNGAKPKPRFHAIRFLNQLSGQRLSSTGNGTYVTALATKTNETVRILLVNYDPKNSHSETFPLKLFGLGIGNYTLNRIDYLGNSTSRQIQVSSRIYQENFFLNPNSATILEFIPM